MKMLLQVLPSILSTAGNLLVLCVASSLGLCLNFNSSYFLISFPSIQGVPESSAMPEVGSDSHFSPQDRQSPAAVPWDGSQPCSILFQHHGMQSQLPLQPGSIPNLSLFPGRICQWMGARRAGEMLSWAAELSEQRGQKCPLKHL